MSWVSQLLKVAKVASAIGITKCGAVKLTKRGTLSNWSATEILLQSWSYIDQTFHENAAWRSQPHRLEVFYGGNIVLNA